MNVANALPKKKKKKDKAYFLYFFFSSEANPNNARFGKLFTEKHFLIDLWRSAIV